MKWVKGPLLYEGKAKKVFAVVGDDQHLWMEYKNSLTAFNAQKVGSFEGKGLINKQIAGLVFKYLALQGVRSHWVHDLSDTEMICEKLNMIPLEVVVRNRVAGSLAKKFNLPEGGVIQTPLVEFYYKNDSLGDPFVSDEQALYLNAVTVVEHLTQLKVRALLINQHLLELFARAEIDLVDFKIELGWTRNGELRLGDEISPDSCRLWDRSSGEKLAKDRFRRDLGKVEESYREVLQRLKKSVGGEQ